MIEVTKLKILTSSLSVLYIEDEISIQKTMFKYLKKFFLNVDIANNGIEGLKLYKENQFDIVISDLSMPKMNGLDMIKEIRELDKNQPILITTAHSEANFLLEAMKLHVDGYIIKPFNYESLNFELFKIAQRINKFKEHEEYRIHLQDMLISKTKEMSENYEKTLISIVELIEQRDTYTAGHSKRVAKYCDLIAKQMNYTQEDCTRLYQAAILHDVGKIETPDSILLNPKALNEVEYALIQEHVNVGYKLLNSIPMFQPLANIVYSHHEKYNGSGYPNQLKGDEINRLARIMIVADAFDAMTTNRIYKGRKTVQEAIEELKSLKNIQFHPEVVDSAIIALKNIVIDNKINQLPKTKLEEERFAYFYRDNISEAYNHNYLDIVLIKNKYSMLYKSMTVFSINKFSAYNNKFGWSEGDKVLIQFVNILSNCKECLVFRVFGDNFILLSENNIDLTTIQNSLKNFMKESSLSYKIDVINLNKHRIETLKDIESIKKYKH